MTSVPLAKMSSMDDCWGIDFERSVASPGIPVSPCSIGTVMSSSTSWADRPSASVCTSTRGGANSGKTSTGVSRSCRPPTTSIAIDVATTMAPGT